MFSQDKYLKALNYASKAHGDQKTAYGLPYVTYLSAVAMEVIHACIQSEIEDKKVDIAISVALLQDIMETTNISYDELYNTFGAEVAEGVDALTKDNTLSEKEQMTNSINKVLTQNYEIQMIILASRLVNMQEPPKTWDSQKIFNHHKEAKFIHSCLKNSNVYLSKRLEEKINNYIVYIK